MKINRVVKLFLVSVFFLFLYVIHYADVFVEPAYCDLESFKKHEVFLGSPETLKARGLKNAHAFQLGKVLLVGVGVGDSKSHALIELAKSHSPKVEEKNYCTWYLNHPKLSEPYDQSTRIEAAKSFNHRDIIRSPSLLADEEAILEIWKAVENEFEENPISFLSCALENHFIALGCNGMVHRGPTVFGMLLAFSGCSSEQSFIITNHYWDPEGLKAEIRLGAMDRAYRLGARHMFSRKRIAAAFTE